MHENVEIRTGSSVFRAAHAYLSRRIDNGDLQPILETSTNAQGKSQKEEIVAHFLVGNLKTQTKQVQLIQMCPQLSCFTCRTSDSLSNATHLPETKEPVQQSAIEHHSY